MNKASLKSSIEFIVVPTLKEKLTSSWSIPMNVINDMEKYKLKFPHFDWSLLQEYNDPLHYYLEDIKDDFAKKILKEKTSDPDDPWGSNAAELVIDYMHQCFPKRAESNRSALERIGRAKKYIHSLLQSKLSDSSGTFSEDSKIVVVSHGVICRLWTGKWDKPLEEYDEIPMASTYKVLKNWQLYADNINFPTLSHHISLF